MTVEIQRKLLRMIRQIQTLTKEVRNKTIAEQIHTNNRNTMQGFDWLVIIRRLLYCRI